MRIPLSRALPALSALLAFSALALTGCGGGGGTDVSSGGGGGGGRFEPNYAAALTSVRRWEQTSLRVYVEPVAPGNAGNGDVVPALKQGLELWKNVPGVPATEYVDDPAEADIVVVVRPTAQLPAGRVGNTTVEFRLPENIITSATLTISEELHGATATQVAAHEMGHALGLDGHSPNNADVMFATTHLPAVVTSSDRNTMAWNYAVTPSRTNPSPAVLLEANPTRSASGLLAPGSATGTTSFGVQTDGQGSATCGLH